MCKMFVHKKEEEKSMKKKYVGMYNKSGILQNEMNGDGNGDRKEEERDSAK